MPAGSAFTPEYQRIFRASPDALLLMRPDGTIVDNSDQHVAVSLKPRDEVVGKTLFEAYPAPDQNQGDEIERSHEHVRRFREAHTMPLIRYDLRVPGGGFEEMYWQAIHYPVLDARGELEFILQRTQNVTEQVQAEREAERTRQALQAEQDRTRFILENLPVMIWTNESATGLPNYYNGRWQAFTGQTAEAGIEWKQHRLVHPDDEARVEREMSEKIAAGQEYQLEFRLRRHDGEYRWILARNVPRRDADGNVTMWVGGGVDVHDQKMMVQELLDQTEQQAVLSEQAYQNYQLAQQQREALYALFMRAPASIAITRGPEHRYEFANALYAEAMGNRPLVGRPAAEAVPELAAQGLLPVLDEVYRTGQPFTAQDVPLEFVRNGQLQRGYYTYIIQRYEESGQPAGLSSYGYEVTELVQLRQALGGRVME